MVRAVDQGCIAIELNHLQYYKDNPLSLDETVSCIHTFTWSDVQFLEWVLLILSIVSNTSQSIDSRSFEELAKAVKLDHTGFRDIQTHANHLSTTIKQLRHRSDCILHRIWKEITSQELRLGLELGFRPLTKIFL
jgi:hypothetical protein